MWQHLFWQDAGAPFAVTRVIIAISSMGTGVEKFPIKFKNICTPRIYSPVYVTLLMNSKNVLLTPLTRHCDPLISFFCHCILAALMFFFFLLPGAKQFKVAPNLVVKLE